MLDVDTEHLALLGEFYYAGISREDNTREPSIHQRGST